MRGLDSAASHQPLSLRTTKRGPHASCRRQLRQRSFNLASRLHLSNTSATGGTIRVIACRRRTRTSVAQSAACTHALSTMSQHDKPIKYAIAVHGGAGVINSTDPAKLEEAYAGLRVALQAGLDILTAGGTALDAVEASVVALEDNPHFNAGRGAVFSAGGKHELEASIMTSDMRCGGAALLGRVKNPIKLARRVMEGTPHILLSGAPAEAYAAAQGLELVDNAHFSTPQRRAQWQAYQSSGVVSRQDEIVQHTQTVGAVAMDCSGALAAATSTGGRTNKWDGRIGDTPLIGSGNYANRHCAVSGTGMGEQFIRYAVAHDVAARVEYKGLSVDAAAAEVVHDVLQPDDGGVVAVGGDYQIAMPFNSVGMYRGAADHTGRFEVGIFKEVVHK